jgi:dihydroxy-acid dehydratase
MNRDRKFPLRSQNWFQNPDNLGMTAVYLERYANHRDRADRLRPLALQSDSPGFG